MPAKIDIQGQSFGRLKVLARAPSQARCTMWKCRCDCGSTLNVATQSLRSGASKSCGCLMKEKSRDLAIARFTTHGMRRSVEYGVWSGMKRRCENKREKSYPRYGGRGIKVKFSSFQEFIDHIGLRPSDDFQIDRINNDGHYEAGNVRWATKAQQALNKRNTLIFEHLGVSKPLVDWCDEYGKNYRVVWQRLSRGMSFSEAMGGGLFANG